MIALVKAGHEVLALTPKGEYFSQFAKHQITAIDYSIERSSLNPFKALKTIQNIAEILKSREFVFDIFGNMVIPYNYKDKV